METYENMTREELIKSLMEMEDIKNKETSANELKKTMHELHVHQIELEMQNRELKEAREELEYSRNRYADLYDFAPCGYITMDEKGLIKEINITGAKLLGRNKEELSGMPFLTYIVSEDSKKFLSYLSRCRKPDKNIKSEVLLSAKKKNGEVIYLELTTVPFQEEDRTLYRTAMIDITERKEKEEEKKKLQEELNMAQKLKSLGTLSGGIAHEFNNILGVILGYAEMTMDELPPDSRLNENLMQIVKSCFRAKDIVKQILFFSQKGKKEIKPLKLSDTIKEAFELINPLIPSTISICKNFEGNSSVIAGDATSIHQILINLCTNAIHSMSEGKGIINVTLTDIDINEKNLSIYRGLSPGHWVKLTVSDTGHGMESNVMEHIFEPFFTTKSTGKGSGMGLSVVHGIVKSHNGDIKVYSTPGKGTNFDIFFPCLNDYNEYIKNETEEKPLYISKGIRILFVDDEETIVAIGEKFLKRFGCNVFGTVSSEEALKVFADRPCEFDLIITDQTMPGMSGIELIKKIKAIRDDIPVILCTGHSDYINEENFSAMGVTKLLMKPFSFKILGEAIQSVSSPVMRKV
ncbi:MAG: ATP-binding protein [Candidatus Eremiobacterota bacterium]